MITAAGPGPSEPGNIDPEYIKSTRILTEGERHRILYEWNDTRADFPDVCVHQLFEQQVTRDPDAVAVVFKERRLSYGELNQRANQVARHLQTLGVGVEILVGVCIPRSPEMLIALLAVWKAGGAYVPLDTAFPPERLRFMARDSGVKIVLTEEKHRSLFPFAMVICLDSDRLPISQENSSNLAAVTVPSNLAYVMYTSGSTGQPKGTMIQHNSLVNYLCWAVKAYAVEHGSSVPIHSSVAFDSTVASLYPPLLAGGQIEVLPEDLGAQSLLAALHREINRSKIVITPAHLELLNRELSPEEIAGTTKILVLAGEMLLAERLSQWRDFAPATRLFNEYGPTEATVGCCAYEVQPDDPRESPVPIGRPIANTQLYVLDSVLQPVPIGATGELYIGGVGVARGYLNRPELSKERFLADPFSGRNGALLYKTGDLARYRKDGILECLGRVDDQVKVRGYRIELGEIEATLAAHPGVRSCTVLAREDVRRTKQLIGYVIAWNRQWIRATELRNFLREKLPEYMVPAHFIFLDSFPLIQNGKIDRRALEAKAYDHTSADQQFVSPRSETEKKLAAIWMELLKIDRVGIHDDFFELGGDSLLAMRAMSQIWEIFGVTVSVRALFPSLTIADLAATLTDHGKSQDRLACAAPIQSAGQRPAFFCVEYSPQLRPLSLLLGADQPFFGIALEPYVIERLKPPYRMEDLAGHLTQAIREKQPQGPYYLGGFCQGATFAYEVARQLMAQGHNVGLLAMLEPKYPSQSPLVRIVTASKRMILRIGSHVEEVWHLGIKGLPSYTRNRRKDVTRWFRHFGWHLFRLQRQAGPRDLEKIVFLAASSYEPAPLSCPTVIFSCTDSQIVSAGDPYSGWRRFLTGHSETCEVPGDHIGIFSGSNVNVLAERLRLHLQKAQDQAALSAN
jgi:amino acid adenylation domain-containing protein